MLDECRIQLCDNSPSERLGGSSVCRRGGVIASQRLCVSNVSIVRDLPAGAHGMIPRKHLVMPIMIASLANAPAGIGERFSFLFEEARTVRLDKKAKTKPPRNT
jgi:hypothetical protein